jgi:hypothetical protein
MADESNRIRVQMDFSPAAFAELVELQERTGASSRGEAVKYALRTLQWLAKEVDQDGRITIAKDNEKVQVMFPFLQESRI